MLDKLERKIGKFAIPGLIRYILGGYAIGYLLYFIGQMAGGAFGGLSMINAMILEPAYIVADPRQIYRILSWVLIPPSFTNIVNPIQLLVFTMSSRITLYSSSVIRCVLS